MMFMRCFVGFFFSDFLYKSICCGYTFELQRRCNLPLQTSRYKYTSCNLKTTPVSILYKSIAGGYRPLRVADKQIMARYRFLKNASWEEMLDWLLIGVCAVIR